MVNHEDLQEVGGQFYGNDLQSGSNLFDTAVFQVLPRSENSKDLSIADLLSSVIEFAKMQTERGDDLRKILKENFGIVQEEVGNLKVVEVEDKTCVQLKGKSEEVVFLAVVEEDLIGNQDGMTEKTFVLLRRKFQRMRTKAITSVKKQKAIIEGAFQQVDFFGFNRLREPKGILQFLYTAISPEKDELALRASQRIFYGDILKDHGLTSVTEPDKAFSKYWKYIFPGTK